MGRLYDLVIQEAKDDRVLEKYNYRQHSGYGNLFHLMLMFVDSGIPLDSSQSLISIMFKDDKTAVAPFFGKELTKLQGGFNKLKKSVRESPTFKRNLNQTIKDRQAQGLFKKPTGEITSAIETELGSVAKIPNVNKEKLYFIPLFDILCSLVLKITNNKIILKQKQLASLFSKRDIGSLEKINYQIKSIAHIFLGAADDKVIELTPQDELLFKKYASSGIEDEIEHIENTEADVSDEEVESNDIVDDEFKEPEPEIDSQEEYTKVDDKPEEIIIPTRKYNDPVKNFVRDDVEDRDVVVMQDQLEKIETDAMGKRDGIDAEIANIKAMLTTNTDSSAFAIDNIDDDPITTEKVNEQIEYLYSTAIKLGFDTETANLIGKYAQNTFKSLAMSKNYITNHRDRIFCEMAEETNGFNVSIKVGASMLRQEQFFTERTFTTKPNGKMHIHHDKLQIPLSAQDHGIAKKLFKEQLKLYEAQGNIEDISLEANVDVGGYAWFNYGFIPDSEQEVLKIASWIREMAGIFAKSLMYDAKDLSRWILNPSDRSPAPDISKAQKNFSDLIAEGSHTQTRNMVAPIIQRLFDKAALHIETNYSKTPEVRKQLCHYVSAGVSPTVTGLHDEPCSISYKALLSLRSMKDKTGFYIMPVNGKGRALSWNGTLRMDQLEQAKAYINFYDEIEKLKQ